MILTDSLREQHTRILHLTKQLTGKINSKSYQNNPDAIVDLIVRLSGILNIHLAMEDKSLYPDIFEDETKMILEALVRRIHKEDSELYPMIEQVGM